MDHAPAHPRRLVEGPVVEGNLRQPEPPLAVKAMQAAGLPSGLAGQLVGATKELHSNVYEHSERSRSGIGVLASLKSKSSARRSRSRRRCAAAGAPARRQPLRGHGFDLIFTGLLNRNIKLRFRSGAAAVTIDGYGTGNPVPLIRDRPAMQGFLVAANCYAMRKRSVSETDERKPPATGKSSRGADPSYVQGVLFWPCCPAGFA